MKRRAEYLHLWNNGDLPVDFQEDTDDCIQIHIVTLRAYLAETATDQALREGVELNQLAGRVNDLLKTVLSDAYEFVHVTSDYICVGIHCDLIDDKAISQALDMVSKLTSFEPGTILQTGQLIQVYENKISSN